MDVVNIAAYKFVQIPDREALRVALQERCDALSLKGSILLAEEGINVFLAGSNESMEAFLNFLATDELFAGRFADLEIKRSFTSTQPFQKMIVRLPKEIITMRHPMIRPEAGRAPDVTPEQLKKWLAQGHDDAGREIVMLDTRNNYEVAIGKFDGAVDFNLENFSQFPDAVRNFVREGGEELREKTIVTYCTGGIRCEKAALFMNIDLNLPNVVQLHGGILNHLETAGADHWSGECFVFDERGAVDASLRPSTNTNIRKTGARSHASA